jgi:hypothetical protein
MRPAHGRDQIAGRAAPDWRAHTVVDPELQPGQNGELVPGEFPSGKMIGQPLRHVAEGFCELGHDLLLAWYLRRQTQKRPAGNRASRARLPTCCLGPQRWSPVRPRAYGRRQRPWRGPPQNRWPSPGKSGPGASASARPREAGPWREAAQARCGPGGRAVTSRPIGRGVGGPCPNAVARGGQAVA